MPGDGLVGVCGACGRVAAHAAEVWGHGYLVHPYRAQSEASHQLVLRGEEPCWRAASRIPAFPKRAVTELLNVLKSAEAASLRAMTTRSHPCSRGANRIASLSLRFIRLRTTAFPIRLPTGNPARVTRRPLRRDTTTRNLSDRARPSRRTVAKSLDLVSRRSLRISLRATGKLLRR
jgi:hypothetical protein